MEDEHIIFFLYVKVRSYACFKRAIKKTVSMVTDERCSIDGMCHIFKVTFLDTRFLELNHKNTILSYKSYVTICT